MSRNYDIVREEEVVGYDAGLDYNVPLVMATTVIIGLGNPGTRYAATRHNVGFRCVSYFAKKHETTFSRTSCRSKIAETTFRGRQVVLAKPRTYMNLSGEAVVGLVRAYRIPIQNLIVVYDDVDLAVGKLRVRLSGGPGGHNGMKSIIDSLNTDQFPRIRVGIGRPSMEDSARWSGDALIDYVLGTFPEEEDAAIQQSVALVSDVLECMIVEGVDSAMNRYN